MKKKTPSMKYCGFSAFNCDLLLRGLPDITLPGDNDGNGVVDLADFAYFPDCMTGPDAGPATPECEVFYFDPDNDVDLGDFAAFQAAFGTP